MLAYSSCLFDEFTFHLITFVLYINFLQSTIWSKVQGLRVYLISISENLIFETNHLDVVKSTSRTISVNDTVKATSKY